MFSDPQASASFLEDTKYIAKLVGMDETAPSTQHPEWGAGVKWRFNLATVPAGGRPSRVVRKKDSTGNETDEPYEYWQFTGSKLTPRTKAWAWIEALLGRSIVQGQDTGEALTQAVIGMKCVIIVGPVRTDSGVVKPDQVLSVQPYVEPAKNSAAKAAPVSAAVAALEDDLPPEQRTGAVAVAEPEGDEEL